MTNPQMGVVVGIPTSRPVTPEWAVGLATQNFPTNTNVCYAPIRGLPVDEARELIVKGAQDLKCPIIWMIDDDVEVPLGTCRQLLQTIRQAADDVMVVAGIYPSRGNDNPEPIVYQQNGHGAFWKWKKNTIFEVTGTIGTGCMMIKTELFNHIEKPWFKTIDSEHGKITDDVWFCEKVVKAGFKILADAHVICTHWDNATMKPYNMPEDSYPMLPKGKEFLKDLPDGWMSITELDWLTEEAARHKRIVELGSYMGRTTVALASSTKGEVWAIDDFRGLRNTKFNGPEKEIARHMSYQDDLFERFQKNIAGHENVKVIEADHADLAKMPPEWIRGKDEDKPDMVFIDGGHEYEEVKRDILAWKERLAPGGLLCGHDSNWPGVRRAIDELIPGWMQGPGAIWVHP